MKKKILLLFLAFAGLLGLAACTVESEPSLTSIAFAGVEDLEVENGESFNFLTGVTATGNDEVDYTDLITITTTSSAVNVDTGELDTLQTGVHFARYEVVVGEGESEVVARHSRYITVKAPTVEEGQMVVNPDMADSISGWNDPTVVYVADGASMTLSHEDGALKAEVVAGSNFFTPRFGQMNVPFENGKTYEVSFKAKSSVEKEIALQVGELLSAAPWYVDFLPETIYRTIGTEWATYSYKFTMRQPEENLRGGILFGLGTVNGNAVDATMYFDDINIEEAQPDADTSGPVINGVPEELKVLVGEAFDLMAGVTAMDAGFGDMTHALVVEVYNSENTKMTDLTTLVAGTYKVMYIVSDPLGNISRLEMTLIVSDEPQWTGYGMSVLDRYEITYSAIAVEWWNSNVQLTLDAFDGTKTEVTFDFIGEAGQSYLFKIEGGGKFAELAVVATGSLQEHTLDLSAMTEAERSALNLVVVFAQTTDASGKLHLFSASNATVTQDWVKYGDNYAMEIHPQELFVWGAGDPNAWWNNNAQFGIPEFPGDHDAVAFEFTGTAGTTYLFKIEGGGKALEAETVATGEMQTFMLDLSSLTEAEREALELLVLFDKTQTGSKLQLHNFGPAFMSDPEWIGYNGVVVGSRTVVSYAGTTASWWENNAQLTLDSFDGTQTVATFEFIGEAGQDYLFKIEGGGKAAEAAITADGTKQTHTVDLSAMTEAERSALNLVVVFAQTLDGSGSIELFSVAEAVVTKDWVAYGMGIAHIDTLTWAAGDPGNPWGFNAQLEIREYPSDKEVVAFTFVGTENSTYKFKIEGGGQAKEIDAVATGEMQKVFLDLSSLTPEQRAGLNLLVVFDLTQTGSTLHFYSINMENPQTVSEILTAGYPTHYTEYTPVRAIGVVAGLTDKGYVIQELSSGHLLTVEDSTNTPAVGDELVLNAELNYDWSIAMLKNVSSYEVKSQGNTPNFDVANAIDMPWTDLDMTAVQGKLVKVSGIWAKLYTGDTSYARIAHEQAGLSTQQYANNYIGLQNAANELNLSGTLADIFTAGEAETEYADVTLYLFFYDSTGSYQKAVILSDSLVVIATT